MAFDRWIKAGVAGVCGDSKVKPNTSELWTTVDWLKTNEVSPWESQEAVSAMSDTRGEEGPQGTQIEMSASLTVSAWGTSSEETNDLEMLSALNESTCGGDWIQLNLYKVTAEFCNSNNKE